MDLHHSDSAIEETHVVDADVDADGEEPSFDDGLDHDHLDMFGLHISLDERADIDNSSLPGTGDFLTGFVSGLHEGPGHDVTQRGASAGQPVVSAAVHDATFSRDLFSNFDATGIKLPWETGIFRELLGDDPLSEPLVPKMPIGEFCSFGIDDTPQHVTDSVASAATTSMATPVFSSCIGSGDDLNYDAKRQQLRDVAIGKFLIVLRQWPTASKTGRHIAELDSTGQQQDEVFEILSSVLGVKSPATLIKRANSLLAFMRWAVRAGKGAECPFCEQIVWEYFQHLKASGAAATRAESTTSSLRFAFYLLGFESLESSLTSRRLIGICEIMLAGKRLIRQALTLTVPQILHLHTILEDASRHIVDRALVAYLLFALYGRCRNSDLLSIHTIETDFNADGDCSCQHLQSQVGSDGCSRDTTDAYYHTCTRDQWQCVAVHSF